MSRAQHCASTASRTTAAPPWTWGCSGPARVSNTPPTDPQLGVAANYPADLGIESDPDAYLFSDFESSDWTQDWTSGTTGHQENLELVSTDPDRLFEPLAGSALRIRVAAGDHYGASFAFKFQDELGEEPTEIYFRYYLRFADDWEPTDTGKLPGISGTYGVAGWGGRPSDGTNGWSARGTFPAGSGSPVPT